MLNDSKMNLTIFIETLDNSSFETINYILQLLRALKIERSQLDSIFKNLSIYLTSHREDLSHPNKVLQAQVQSEPGSQLRNTLSKEFAGLSNSINETRKVLSQEFTGISSTLQSSYATNVSYLRNVLSRNQANTSAKSSDVSVAPPGSNGESSLEASSSTQNNDVPTAVRENEGKIKQHGFQLDVIAKESDAEEFDVVLHSPAVTIVPENVTNFQDQMEIVAVQSNQQLGAIHTSAAIADAPQSVVAVQNATILVSPKIPIKKFKELIGHIYDSYGCYGDTTRALLVKSDLPVNNPAVVLHAVDFVEPLGYGVADDLAEQRKNTIPRTALPSDVAPVTDIMDSMNKATSSVINPSSISMSAALSNASVSVASNVNAFKKSSMGALASLSNRMTGKLSESSNT